MPFCTLSMQGQILCQKKRERLQRLRSPDLKPGTIFQANFLWMASKHLTLVKIRNFYSEVPACFTKCRLQQFMKSHQLNPQWEVLWGNMERNAKADKCVGHLWRLHELKAKTAGDLCWERNETGFLFLFCRKRLRRKDSVQVFYRVEFTACHWKTRAQWCGHHY